MRLKICFIALILVFLASFSFAASKPLSVELASGVSVSVPLDALISSERIACASDTCSAEEQAQYIVYQTTGSIDMNKDGTPDYAIKIQAFAGSPGSFQIVAQWQSEEKIAVEVFDYSVSDGVVSLVKSDYKVLAEDGNGPKDVNREEFDSYLAVAS